jgi:hypothetical protein
MLNKNLNVPDALLLAIAAVTLTAVTVAGSTPSIVLQNCYFNPLTNPLA